MPSVPNESVFANTFNPKNKKQKYNLPQFHFLLTLPSISIHLYPAPLQPPLPLPAAPSLFLLFPHPRHQNLSTPFITLPHPSPSPSFLDFKTFLPSPPFSLSSHSSASFLSTPLQYVLSVVGSILGSPLRGLHQPIQSPKKKCLGVVTLTSNHLFNQP